MAMIFCTAIFYTAWRTIVVPSRYAVKPVALVQQVSLDISLILLCQRQGGAEVVPRWQHSRYVGGWLCTQPLFFGWTGGDKRLSPRVNRVTVTVLWGDKCYLSPQSTVQRSPKIFWTCSPHVPISYQTGTLQVDTITGTA